MTSSSNDLVQRKHYFAIVDEVDSVLIDDARTPLIISGPVPKGDRHEFDQLKPKVSSLFLKQKQLLSNVLIEAKKRIKDETSINNLTIIFNTLAFRLLLNKYPRPLTERTPVILFFIEAILRLLILA